jgi:hypothetical protein
MKLHRSIVLGAVALLLGCSGLFAQTPTAEVTGTVLDASGAAVPKAAVKVTNVETNVVSEKDTNDTGAFTILNLLPGNYVLSVEKDGFKTVALPIFKLDVDQNLTESITMEVGSTSESVTVSASAVGQLIQRSTTDLGTIMDETAVREMPLNGRSFTQLLILQPGVNPVDTAQGNSAGSTGIGSADGGNIGIPKTTIYRPSVNGASSRSNIWYLDGVINTESTAGVIATPVIADTIQEFKMMSHIDDPGYGNVMGAVVNVATKAGTNSFHGDAWDFARSNIFDARNPFTGFCSPVTCPKDAAAVAAGTETSSQLSAKPVGPVGYSQNEYGGTLGGPIFKNKTFFFIGYEGWRYSTPSNSFTTDPTPNELAGDFSGLTSQCAIASSTNNPVASCGDISASSPALAELQGTVNKALTGVTPNQIMNPYAEFPGSAGCNPGLTTAATAGVSAECNVPGTAAGTKGLPVMVPFQCEASNPTIPLPLVSSTPNTPNYGVQTTLGTGTTAVPCNIIPAGLIDQNMVKVIQAYLGNVPQTCQFVPNYVFEVHNCFDARETQNDSNNMDARIDQHFGTKDTIFGRASMFWDNSPGVNTGTTSVTNSPYHTWNIGGSWDHIFTPNVILEVRGGVNSRPVQINPTNSLGYSPETSTFGQGLSSTQQGYLSQTQGFYIASLSGYASSIGNVGTELRANPESDIDGVLTWTHGKHDVKIGGSYLYENRLESNNYLQFNFSNTQTCPLTVASSNGAFTTASNFSCSLPTGGAIYSGFGNALASALLDLPSSFGANLPQFEEIHATMTTAGGFIQDSWHIKPKLTLNIGVRYDYDFPVTLLQGNGAGETINAFDYPESQYIIGAAETSAYTNGCGTPVVPPCVPGGLNSSNPVFNVTVGDATNGLKTYNTLNNITFTGGAQAGLQRIGDNFGPRVGLAWQLLPNTVLRVGAGLFYDTLGYREQYAENEMQGSTWPYTRGGLGGGNPNINVTYVGNTATGTNNQPICYTAAECGPYLGNPSGVTPGLIGTNPIGVTPTPWAQTGYTNAPHYSDPRSEQWNVQIERQLSSSMMISIAYVGSKTQRLDYCCSVNVPNGGPFCENYSTVFTCSTTPETQAAILESEDMPWVAPTGQHYDESTGYANYNAAEAQFQKRFSNGLETLAAFTWSRCFADTNGDFGVENGNETDPAEYYSNPSLAYGPCSNDIPIVFQWSAVYQLPFGRGEKWMNHGVLATAFGNWEASFAYLARSGQNFNPSWSGAGNVCTATVTTGCVPLTIAGYENVSGDPANLSSGSETGGTNITGYSRPDEIAGCSQPSSPSVTEWFNPTCYVSPASPSVGPGYGFGTVEIGGLKDMFWNNVDFDLMKNFKITESKVLQIRVEAFNVFNHMILGNPSDAINPKISGGAISYGTAGVISSIANTPRELQLAAKFTF